MRPLMAERAGAAARSPKGALLDLVRSADAMVLIIGARYGDAAAGETSPTEDEFNEAVAAGRPVVVLVENVNREPAQEEFLRRVRGTWSDGSLTTSFDGADDIEIKAIAALRALEVTAAAAAIRPVAEARAEDLARGATAGGHSGHGSPARIALVPLVDAQLINDAALNRGQLGDEMTATARGVGLIPQRLGVEASLSGASGIALQAAAAFSADSISVTVDRRGAIAVEAPVQGTGNFASMLIDPDRLRELIDHASAFAIRAWSTLDTSQRIGQACAAVGIPGAQNRVYGRTSGSSISMGGAMRLPQSVVAPQPALLVRRADVGTARLTDPLLAAVERVFRDANAVTGL